jgi:5-methylcytosine-specific restriction enzyme A
MNCFYCDKLFSYRDQPSSHRKFCSRKCQDKCGATRGLKRTEESKRKLGKRYLRDGNPAWKGGISLNKGRNKYNVKHKRWREAVLKRDNYTCRYCNKNKDTNKNIKITVDHIRPFALFPELRWELSNGQALCKECHRKKTSWEHKMYWKNQFNSSSVYLMPKEQFPLYSLTK